MIFGPHFFSWVHFPSQTSHCNHYNPQKPEKYLLIKSVDHSIFFAETADHVRAAESPANCYAELLCSVPYCREDIRVQP